MTEHKPLAAGAMTEEAFMADRMQFWHAWNKFAFYSSVAIALLTIYICTGLGNGFTFGHTLLLLIVEILVVVRALA
jgi:hypothetical protein